jgi:hypothetical protein
VSRGFGIGFLSLRRRNPRSGGGIGDKIESEFATGFAAEKAAVAKTWWGVASRWEINVGWHAKP